MISLLWTLISSCSGEPPCSRSETEQWKLGWRMIENSWGEDHNLAAEQFDSLRQCPDQIEYKFWNMGLSSLKKTQTKDQFQEVVEGLSPDLKQELYDHGVFIRELDNLTGFTPAPVTPPTHPELRIELLKMFIDDQNCRGNLMQSVIQKFGLEDYEPNEGGMVEVDRKNRIRLQEIQEEYGFPTAAMVGKEGMEGVFLVIQHAGNDKEWQRSQLPNVKAAFERGELEGQHYALLYDRVMLGQGEKQRYGTQIIDIDPITKEVVLDSLEDPDNLDQRRMELGMSPIYLYKKIATGALE